jgi:hypothetical protein
MSYCLSRKGRRFSGVLSGAAGGIIGEDRDRLDAGRCGKAAMPLAESMATPASSGFSNSA